MHVFQSIDIILSQDFSQEDEEVLEVASLSARFLY